MEYERKIRECKINYFFKKLFFMETVKYSLKYDAQVQNKFEL